MNEKPFQYEGILNWMNLLCAKSKKGLKGILTTDGTILHACSQRACGNQTIRSFSTQVKTGVYPAGRPAMQCCFP